jgi:hypothetical protein
VARTPFRRETRRRSDGHADGVKFKVTEDAASDHMQMALHATDAFSIIFGVKSGFSM